MDEANGSHARDAPSSLKLVEERLPQVRAGVARLFERDQDFRDLCDEYEACVTTLARLGSAEPMRKEYGLLQLRLEAELLRYLAERG
jgi:hypothetical protein